MSLVSFWFGTIAVLWIGYLILEGFDFGVGTLLRVVGKDEDERTQILRTIGPVWDGNEVWLLVAGGATFAAFPEWYATMFSGFYLALLLILVGLILRAMAVEYRNKETDPAWRARWDWVIVGSSALVALLWGVAFVNIVRGVPLDETRHFTGNLLTLLNPQALLGGVATLSLFALHGAYFLALRTEGEVREKAHAIAQRLWPVATLVGAVTLVWIVLTNADGSWVAWLGTVLAAVALLVQPLIWKSRNEVLQFALTTVAILGIVITIFGALWPNVLPSTGPAGTDLTAVGASSTHYTLKVMTYVAVVMTPIVLVYQAWTYWVFRQRIAPTARGAKLGFDTTTSTPAGAASPATAATPATDAAH
ncbi:MAG: cytochrome d ubiquinol oxidase subunit II [Solirubrobacteraceae bacterium]|nr:cytochrome d ubiquinol oxidase subunit II [Solirubrobacteraceae bacterium]